MSTLLEFGTDIGGRNAYAPQPSNTIFTATLANGVPGSITLPASAKAWIVSFVYTPGATVWVDFTGAEAAVPAGGSFAPSTSELNPGARFVKTYKNDGVTQTTISLLTSNVTADVCISLFALPTGQ